MYRPDTKQFTEVFGVNQYSSQAACERGRDAQVAANARVVSYLHNLKQQFEADRFGVCHCDMTIDRSSPNYLTDAQRFAQLRLVEDIRLRIRERLLDSGLTSDSEQVRGLWSEQPVTPLLAGSRLAPMPQSTAMATLTSADDLKATRTLDTNKPAVAALDLPLVDVVPENTAAAAPASPATQTTVTTAPPVAATVSKPESKPTEEAPIETVDVPPPIVVETHGEAQPEQVVRAEDAPSEDEVQSAQETAESFVSYETQRIQNVLRASAAIADESVKSKIFEAAMQRIQLLSNLRLLIEGSGMRSRLAAAAREAGTEQARLALMTRLFGEDVVPHWAPKDAADVVFNVDPAIAAAPERVLRDTTGTYSAQQKKHALYLVLAQTQPTEDQRLWLSAVVEGFLE
jgi:hypothetical protein